MDPHDGARGSMRIAPILAVLLAGGVADADAPAATTLAGFAGDTLQLALRDHIVVSYPGATAVFSIDATVVEASVVAGRIAIAARGVGATTISVVSATGVAAVRVTVVPPAPWLAQGGESASRRWTVWQSDYQSLPER